MATKLKKMKLTSVDLVRAGANQEADICLYKSADPQEAAEGPAEDEKSIFKRFLAFIRGTPTKAENEPHSPVEKAEEPADIESIYKSALVDSIHSIYTDDNLTDIEKKAMAEQSIGQFQERMKETWDDEWDDDDPEDWNDEWDDDPDDDPEDDRYDDIEEVEVQKFNPNHDSEGKFSSSGGGGGAAPAAGGGQGDAKYDKPYHNQARRLAENVGSKKMSGEISAKKVKEAVGRGGTVKEFAGKAYMISPQPSGGIACYTGTKGARGKFNIERFTSGLRTLEDAQMWGVGTILNNN